MNVGKRGRRGGEGGEEGKKEKSGGRKDQVRIGSTSRGDTIRGKMIENMKRYRKDMKRKKIGRRRRVEKRRK